MPNPSLVAFPGRLTITDAAGVPCPGGQLHISAKLAGSRGDAREPMAVYADAAHSIPLPNPVVADADGMLPMIYLSSSPFDCIASKADCKILWAYFDCKGYGNAATAPGVLFDPTRLDWGPNVRFKRVAGPDPADIASADLLKRLGISPDAPSPEGKI